MGIGAATSALTQFNNSLVAQTDKNFSGIDNLEWKTIGRQTLSGAVGGAFSAGAGTWASSSKGLINGFNSPLLKSLVVSPIASGAGHIGTGLTWNLMEGQSFGEALENSMDGLGKSMINGAITGAAVTTAQCLMTGVNPINGKKISVNIDKEILSTLDRIDKGEKHWHHNDGSVYENREGLLPSQKEGYYREYVHPTPGAKSVGPQRIIIGNKGDVWYTPDHYKTFIPIIR